MDLDKMMQELKRLNPYVEFCDLSNFKYNIIIAKCDDCNKLKFPEGYSYSERGELTRESKASEEDDIFYLMTIEEYLIKQA